MSTRSFIARSTGISTFEGTYVHSDGYPTGVGKELWVNLQKYGEDRVLHRLLVEHTAGWSAMAPDLWNPEPMNAREAFKVNTLELSRDEYIRYFSTAKFYPEEEGQFLFTDETVHEGEHWCEYGYIINPQAQTMTILDVASAGEPPVLAMIDLTDPFEPNWEAIEDGTYATEQEGYSDAAANSMDG